MQHQLLMRGLYRLRHPKKELQTCSHVQTLRIAKHVYGIARDILHDKIGPTRRCHATIQQTRNSGMLQPSEKLALLLEALCQRGRENTLLQNLYGHLLQIDAIGPFRQVDRAHATATQFSQQTITSNRGLANNGVDGRTWDRYLPGFHGEDPISLNLKCKEGRHLNREF